MNKPEQLRLAADIIEKGLEWEYFFLDMANVTDGWRAPLDNDMNPVERLATGYEIRIKPTAPKPKKIPLGPEDVPLGVC